MAAYPGCTLQVKTLFLTDQLWFMTRIREEEEEEEGRDVITQQ